MDGHVDNMVDKQTIKEPAVETENQIFKIQTETGEIKEAELITVVFIDGKKYAIYIVENDQGTIDILASYVRKDDEGYDILVDIDNEDDKKKVAEFISDLLS